MKDVTVIGLGTMGATLARLLLQNGYCVTVWNRTIAKADSLVQEGAVLASSAAAAVSASPIVLVCVHNYQAIHQIFDLQQEYPHLHRHLQKLKSDPAVMFTEAIENEQATTTNSKFMGHVTLEELRVASS